MALYRALVTLNMTSGLNEDAATNSWYFDADTEGDLPDVFDAIEEFYQTVMVRFSPLIDGSNCTVEFYRLSDPTPRSPVLFDTFTGITLSPNPGPTEVALVMSYQAEKVSGLPQARRRGRVYLGPLYDDLPARPQQILIDSVATAATALLGASQASASWTWAQYSPTNGSGTDVDNIWIDNEWDTQRRRGRKATQRTTVNA